MAVTNLVKKFEDIMRKDQGVDGSIQRLQQITWLLFLKAYDFKEEENELLIEDYQPVIPVGYRWRDWANPLKENGEPDVKNQMTGEELINFVDNALIPVLKGNSIEVNGMSKVLFTGVDEQSLLVKSYMGDVNNLMKNGYFLRELLNALNEVDLGKADDSHEFSQFYEGIMDGLSSMGKYGEFHTPKAITKFIVDKIDPKLGETMADFACGTGGFMVDVIEKIKTQMRAGSQEDYAKLQKSVQGGEFKPMPYKLSVTNLMLHGIDLPNIRYGDSLDVKNYSEYFDDDLLDIICLNPPYGGIASQSDKLAFPANMRSSETVDLFVALAVRRLKKNGRGAIIVPDGFLFGNDNAKLEIKKSLLEECDLHTVIRLPQSCFAPYTSIATNLLFFDKTAPTNETWFYRLDMPEGYKHFSKTKPMKREHFALCDEWWNNRVEIMDEKEHEDMSDTWKAKKFDIDKLIIRDKKGNVIDINLDRCGYPVEEKIILSPEETIQNYEEKFNELNKKRNDILNELKFLLKI